MLERLQKLLDRIESRIALWAIIQGSGIVSGGVISGWIASAEAWVDSYGALGWWFASLLGALSTALIFMAFAGLRYLWIKASAMREWQMRVDEINPLSPEFHRKRIKILDIVNPMDNLIGNKRFIDCELLGPANILLIKSVHISGTSFAGCDVVALRPDGAAVQNAVGLDHVQIIGGTIWSCTILIPHDLIPTFSGIPNINIITPIDAAAADGYKTSS